MTPKRRARQVIRWRSRAYQHWVDSGGTATLRQSVSKTAPRWATTSDEQRITADLIAEGQVIYEAVIGAINRI